MIQENSDLKVKNAQLEKENKKVKDLNLLFNSNISTSQTSDINSNHLKKKSLTKYNNPNFSESSTNRFKILEDEFCDEFESENNMSTINNTSISSIK